MGKRCNKRLFTGRIRSRSVECYVIVGLYQGKYRLEGDTWKQQIPEKFKAGYENIEVPKDKMKEVILESE